MAEGGNKDDNPFSFQQFVKTSKQHNKQDDQTDSLIFEESRPRTPKKKSTSKLIVIVDDKTSKRDENTFSFKQFLKKDTENKHPSKMKPNVEDVQDSFKLPDFAVILPDFVQDNYYTDHTLRERKKSCDDNNLGDREQSADADPIIVHRPSITSATANFTGNSSQKSRAMYSELKLGNSTRSKPSITAIPNSLPDFLSDGPMPTGQSSDHDFEQDCSGKKKYSVHANGKIPNELKYEEMKNRLQEANQLVLSQSQKIQNLQDEIKVLRTKETEETTALEMVVQNVESNLKSAKQRAIAAETLASTLKQELKTLQLKVNTLTIENEVLKSGDSRMIGVTNKAKIASQELEIAAKAAEQNIRQLLAGVTTLNLIASSLYDIDKLTEDVTDGNQ